jgi:hypothetical protein
MSNLEGMLSFLNRHPEDYARMSSAGSTSLPQATEQQTITSPDTGSNLLPEIPSPDSKLPSDSSLQSDTDLTVQTDEQPDSKLIPVGNLPSGCNLLSGSDLPQKLGGNLVIGTDPHLPAVISPLSGSRLLSGSELITKNGRTVRIRMAKSVQDAHTPAEHAFLTTMWRRAAPETQETRLLKAGLADLGYWTGAHKTRCRAYIRALIVKLAIEEAETYRAHAGREGATVYRIFSFNAILERRRQTNLTHVIRTGGVYFVDPHTGLRLEPGSSLLSGSSLITESNLHIGSNLQPAAGSSLESRSGSKLLPLINKRNQEDATTTSSAIAAALIKHLGHSDDDAVTRINKNVRERCPDATEDEIVHFIEEQGSRFMRMKALDNPMGMLIRHLPKCFEGESFRLYRQEQEAERQRREAAEAQLAASRREWQRILDDPNAPDEEKEWARLMLGP